MKIRGVGIGIGLAGIVLIVLSVTGVFGSLTPLASVTGGCVTFTPANPSSTAAANPSAWNTNQAQQLSSLVSLNNCGPSASVGVPFQLQLSCQNGCGSGVQYPLTPVCSGCGPGTVQVFMAFLPSSPLCSTTSTCTGWLNYTLSSSLEGSYPAGAFFNAVWTAYTSPPGTSSPTATVTGYAKIGSGIIIQPQDFSISATVPAPFNAGTLSTSTITITPLNGFTSSVSLGVACSSSSVNTCNISPTTINGGSGTASVSLGSNCCPGTYTFTVTGTGPGGSPSHNTGGVSFTINNGGTGSSTPDFTISSTLSVIAFNVGSVATAPITISPINGFTGTVVLTASAVGVTGSGPAPSGASCSVSPTSIVLGVAQIATLSVSASQAVNFACIITGTSGSTSHSLSVIMGTVPGTGISFAWITLAIGIVLTVAPFLMVRRRRTL